MALFCGFRLCYLLKYTRMRTIVISPLLARYIFACLLNKFATKTLQIYRMVAKGRLPPGVHLLGGQRLAFAELKDRVLQPGDAITVSCLTGMGGVGAHCLSLCSSAWDMGGVHACWGGVGACRHARSLMLSVIARLKGMRCTHDLICR